MKPARHYTALLARHLHLALSVISAMAFLWLWLVATPQLDKTANLLESRKAELRQRQFAQAHPQYQPLLLRLQQPLPAPAIVISDINGLTEKLGLPKVNYSLGQPKAMTLANKTFISRKLSMAAPDVDSMRLAMLWSAFREAWACEVVLKTLSVDGHYGHAEFELIGTDRTD